MRNKIIFFLSVISALSILMTVQGAKAKAIFSYHRLFMKDLEQMDRYVRAKILESQKSESDQVTHLVDASLTLFSRPNLDNMIEKIAPILLAELSSNDLTEVVFSRMVDESLVAIKDLNKDVSAEAQITYLIALENWMLEMKSRLHNEEIKKIYQKIAESDVKASGVAKASADRHMPYRLIEPVELSKKIMQEYMSGQAVTPITDQSQKIKNHHHQKKNKDRVD